MNSDNRTKPPSEPQMTDENMECEGHLDPPFPCKNCQEREAEGQHVPCLKTAKTVEALL